MSPVTSGLIGSLIAGAICVWWLKKHPFQISKKHQKELMRRYKRNIQISNVLFITVLIGAIAIFKSGVVSSNDWRAGLIFLGSAFASPFIPLNLPPKIGARNFSEALTAYAIKQYTPVTLLYFILSLGLVMVAGGLVGLLA